MQRASVVAGARRVAALSPCTMMLSRPCRSASGARRRQRARHGSAPHRCNVLAAILLSGGASALDVASRRTAVTRLAAAAVAAGAAPALADPRWPPDDAFGRAPPRGFTASVSDAAVGAARKQRERQRESALKELAVQERFQDDRMRRCREEVSDAWQDCFFLGTTPSQQRRRGPATW